MKIRWTNCELSVPPEREAENIAKSKARKLQGLSKFARPPLAVVGGGPSAVDYVDELRGWAGDMWVSGSAFQWVKSLGVVNPTFFTIDQHPRLAADGVGAKKAILATCCDPLVFHELRDAKVEVFDLVHGGEGANHWATTVTAAPKIALDMGYTDITFYGCDSSYRNRTHAYYDEPVIGMLRVSSNGESFLTNPGFLLQAEFLCKVIGQFPTVFKMRGDGLLAAMVKSQDHDITHGERSLAERINKGFTDKEHHHG